MEKLEKTIRDVLLKKRGQEPGDCLEPERLAAYAEGALDEGARGQVERHLAACDRCLEEVVMVTELLGQGGVAETVLRAFDAVVEFLDQSVQVFQGLGRMTAMPELQAAPVRGAQGPGPVTARFSQAVGNLKLELELERRNGNVADLRVRVFEGGVPLERGRVSLIAEDRELDSELTRNGAVRFDSVRFGDYALRIGKGGEALGEVSLRIREG